jgi:hypothetical protein
LRKKTQIVREFRVMEAPTANWQVAILSTLSAITKLIR